MVPATPTALVHLTRRSIYATISHRRWRLYVPSNYSHAGLLPGRGLCGAAGARAIPNHTSLLAAPASHIPAPMPAVTSSLPNSSLSALPGISIPPSTGTSLLSYSLVVCRLFISTHPSVTVHKGLPNRLLNIIGTNTLSLLCLFPPFLLWLLLITFLLPHPLRSFLYFLFLLSSRLLPLHSAGYSNPSTIHSRVTKTLQPLTAGFSNPSTSHRRVI